MFEWTYLVKIAYIDNDDDMMFIVGQLLFNKRKLIFKEMKIVDVPTSINGTRSQITD